MVINTIGVVGAGTMGSGIAQVAAQSGLQVTMVDVAPAALERAHKSIVSSLDRLVAKDKLDAAGRAQALARIATANELAALRSADLVIEAATENLDIKLKILRELDALLTPEALIASNTSSLSITVLAAVIQRPERFIGMHFFNPVPVMGLIELIRGLQTADATHAAVEALARRLGKTPISVRNAPGFVVNRILCPMINEAVFALQEGLASAEDIDAGMRLGANHPIGPLALADMIGIDVLLAVMDVLYEGFRDPKYRPPTLLREMVAAGLLGRKSGRGFFSYR
ncbi:MAG: 3-hydroxybutyryl-CoA dehydrogenase [Rhodocyclaceae bacterium]|nr:3-hydroxybutyryl-CoA dehydrogenase [Rhodocyclaceae bacterium]MCG3187663.1 3-hydroxybutyryl-CoA dehydrogenase [Rhodocyclaceae bacterium]